MGSSVVELVRTRSARGLTLLVAAAALAVAARHAPPRAPVAVAIVVDASDSMNGGDELAAAVAAADRVIDSLGPDDRFAIIAASTRARTLVAPTAATDDARARAHAALASLDADGGTDLSDAILLGARSIDRGRIVLITDGDPTEGERNPAALAALAARIASRGVSISTTAIGPYADHALLASLETK